MELEHDSTDFTTGVMGPGFRRAEFSSKLCVFSLHVLYAPRLPDLYLW